MQAFNAAYPWVILCIGLFDAAATLAGGVAVAAALLVKVDVDLYDRVFPSFIVLVLSTIAAAFLLSGTRWMLGG
jgi:hypothetical protein